jgi:uncharacterized membrane protein YedE/YeeE
MRPPSGPYTSNARTAIVVAAWVAASAAVVVATVAAGAYFALGRPDIAVAGGWLSQAAAGTGAASGATAAPDALTTLLLRGGVAGFVVAIVAVIGGIGARDAWQSHRRQAAGARPRERGARAAAADGLAPDDRHDFEDAADRPSATARTRARRRRGAGLDPEPWQEGTA